jgi:hypothetical protein
MTARRSLSRHRRWGAAIGATAAGLAIAAGAGTASAASAYSCIDPSAATDASVSNVTDAVDLDVTFTSDFPDVIVGKPFSVTPAVRYSLGNDYLVALGEAGILDDGPNDLNGITFWVAISGANTVEGRQVMRATVNASAGTKVIWDDSTEEASVQKYTNTGTNSAPVWVASGDPTPNLAGSATLNTTGIQWTPKSADPVKLSVAPAGSLGQLPVKSQWLRNSNSANAPTGTNANEYLAAARPYGSIYLRLRFGTAGGNGGNDPGVDSGGRSSLDCVPGSVYTTGAWYTTSTDPDVGTPIKYSEGGNVAPGTTNPRPGDRGRYQVNSVVPTAFAETPTDASAKPFVCLDGLGRQGGLNREVNYSYNLAVTTGDPGSYTPGRPYALRGTKVTAVINSAMVKGLYANLLSYESLPSGGHLDQPLDLWIAISGENTGEGLQVVKATARWQAEFLDPDGVSGSGDETFPASNLLINIPDTNWTPTGAGPIRFSVAPPGRIPTLTLVGRGHSGAAGAVFPFNPYGSLVVRAETGRYGETLDCLEGSIAITNSAIAWSNLGSGDPAVRIPTPVAEGAPPASTTVASGSLGRYTITSAPSAPFAVVPAAAVVPVAPKAKTAAPKPAASTYVRGGTTYLRVTATLPKALAGRSAVVQRKVGKKNLTVRSVKVPKTGKVNISVALKTGTRSGALGVKGAKSIRIRVVVLGTKTATPGVSAFTTVAVKQAVKKTVRK